MYAAGRLEHAHYSLNSCSESFASGSQLKNVLKLIFYASQILYAPPFLLKYFSFDKSDVYYTILLIDFFASRSYENSCSVNSAYNSVNIISIIVLF